MKLGYILGIDEAGRGPLAGPVTLAYVASPVTRRRKIFRNIRDSKKLTPRGREEWFEILKNHPELQVGVTSVGPGTIDKRGITAAVKIGINRLLRRLNIKPKMILLDGSLFAPPECPQKTIIKGDEKIPIISAASIIAKVSRDRKMLRLHKKYPKYGFDKHKGYGTKAHLQKLKIHGACAIHRTRFAPIAKLI